MNMSQTGRRSGRTTALAMAAIAMAIANPGVEVYFVDHFGTRESNVEMMYRAQRVVEKLGLIGLEFSRATVSVRFNLVEFDEFMVKESGIGYPRT